MYFTMVNIISKFYPDEYLESAYKVDYEALYEDGIRGIIYDIDNTLVMHGYPADDRSKELLARLDKMGFGITFLSNNKEMRVKSFRDEALKSAHYIFKAGKPKKSGYLKAMELMGTDKKSTIFIGDQLFTDVWGAKRCGIRNICLKPIDKHEEIQIVLKRILERIILRSYSKYLADKEKASHF